MILCKRYVVQLDGLIYLRVYVKELVWVLPYEFLQTDCSKVVSDAEAEMSPNLLVTKLFVPVLATWVVRTNNRKPNELMW
jgi:hypothetical protein